jgi:hypothetical protein
MARDPSASVGREAISFSVGSEPARKSDLASKWERQLYRDPNPEADGPLSAPLTTFDVVHPSVREVRNVLVQLPSPLGGSTRTFYC